MADEDTFFKGEVDNLARQTAVARQKFNAATTANRLLALAKAYHDSRQEDSQSREASLQELLRVAANDSCELAVIDAKQAVSQHRLAGLQQLKSEGLASWWEARKAAAAVASLSIERRKMVLVGQIRQLCVQIAEHSSPLMISESAQVSQVEQTTAQ